MCPTSYDASKVCTAMDAPTLVVLPGDDTPEVCLYVGRLSMMMMIMIIVLMYIQAPLANAVTLMDGFTEKKSLPYMIR